MKRLKKFLPVLILTTASLLAIVTRFYRLGDAPKGLYLDEAGQGYSAYSTLLTGKDEFGKPFPIVFRSFNDFKTPVYIYLVVPLIPLFGLTKFTVRFPSFFFSILTIPLLYLLIKKITPQKWAEPLALTSSLILAISPWHILFGRTNFECNVALFFFLLGVYFFYQSLKRPWFFLLCSASFAIAIPSYHAQRLVTPAIAFLLLIRHRKTIFSPSYRKFFFGGLIIGLLISLPTLSVVLTPGFLARATGLNIFNYDKGLPWGFASDYRGPLGWLVNNKPFLSLIEFSSLYLSYFSPRNMFVLGDYGPRSSFPYLSTFFIWQFPLYVYGLYLLLKQKTLGELKFFVIALLLISPLPAAVTRDPYSTIRALQMVIPLIIIISLAIIAIYQKLTTLFKYSYIFLFFVLISYSILKLYSSVIILNEYYRAEYWNYGWELVVEKIKKFEENLPVVMDNARSEAYIQLAFFLKYDPESFQKQNTEVNLDEYYTKMERFTERKMGQIETRAINWKTDVYKNQYLIGDSLSISEEQIQEHQLKLIERIYYPDKRVAFIITKTDRLKKCEQIKFGNPLCVN